MEIPLGDHVIYNNDEIQFTIFIYTISNTHHPYPGQCMPSPILFALCCKGYPTQFLPPALASNGYARSAQATRFFGQARMLNGMCLLRGVSLGPHFFKLYIYCEFCDLFLILVSGFQERETRRQGHELGNLDISAAAAWLKTFPTKLSLKNVGFVWRIGFFQGLMFDVEESPRVTLNFEESQRLLQCHSIWFWHISIAPCNCAMQSRQGDWEVYMPGFK